MGDDSKRAAAMASFCRLTILGLALLFASVVGAPADSAFASPRKGRIGVLVPLSGPLAPFGLASFRGFELAAKDEPRIKDVVEFVFEDTQYDNKLVVAAFEKLAASNDVDAFYVFGTGPVEVIAPLAEQRRAATFAVTSDGRPLIGRRYLLHFAYDIADYAEVLMAHFRANSLKTLPVIMADTTFTRTLFDSLADAASGERLINLGTFPPQDLDFRSSLLRLRSTKADAVGLLMLTGQLGPVYKQLHELKLGVKTFTTEAIDNPTELRAAGPAASGAIFPTPKVKPEFASRYEREYLDATHASWAANAYDFAMYTHEALSSVVPEDAEETLDRFWHATPTRQASENRRRGNTHGTRSLLMTVELRQVQNGRSKPLQ